MRNKVFPRFDAFFAAFDGILFAAVAFGSRRLGSGLANGVLRVPIAYHGLVVPYILAA
jgi:hypothetical protein